jgi:hypothetical protein
MGAYMSTDNKRKEPDMSDVSEKKKLLESKFFTFIHPYLLRIDTPSFFTIPFSWLYILFAVVFLLSPVVVLVMLIGKGAFESGDGKLIFAVILALIAVIAAAWISFQVWWNRRKVIHTDKLDIHVIIGAFAHFVSILTEAIAHYIGIAGFFIGLFALIFDDRLAYVFSIPFPSGLGIMVASLIIGYSGVWIAKLTGFLFRKIFEIVVYVLQRAFFFLVHIVKQLFEYFFIYVQSIVDFVVNGWKVVVALVAKLGNTLLAIAHAPVHSNKASITYNRE